MIEQPKSFTIVDPRTLDGTVFEVADAGVQQLAALAELTKTAIEGARAMALNAELERQVQSGEAADKDAFAAGPHGKRWDRVERQLGEVYNDLVVLRKVAAFNPKGR